MRVAITGASGLIGRALVGHLSSAGHDPVPLSRPADWDPERGWMDGAKLATCDGVVHLAGVGIAEHRWTDDHKKRVMDSRVGATDRLVESERGPKVLVDVGVDRDDRRSRGREVTDEERGQGGLATAALPNESNFHVQ